MNNFETGVCVGYLLNRGKSANLGTKSITQNGLYNASDDNLDGYNSVNVNVDDGSVEIARLRRQIADLQEQIAQKDATIAEQQEEIDHCRECQAGVKAAIEAIIGSD